MLPQRRRQPSREVRKIQRYVDEIQIRDFRGQESFLIAVDAYLKLLKSAKVHGYKGYEQNYAQNPSDENFIQTDYPTATQAKGAKGSDFRLGNTLGPKGERF